MLPLVTLQATICPATFSSYRYTGHGYIVRHRPEDYLIALFHPYHIRSPTAYMPRQFPGNRLCIPLDSKSSMSSGSLRPEVLDEGLVVTEYRYIFMHWLASHNLPCMPTEQVQSGLGQRFRRTWFRKPLSNNASLFFFFHFFFFWESASHYVNNSVSSYAMCPCC